MKRYGYVLAALAIAAASMFTSSTVASAQSVIIDAGGARDGHRGDRDGMRGRDHRDRGEMGFRAERNRNPYAGRSMRRGHSERVVVIKRRHRHHHGM